MTLLLWLESQFSISSPNISLHTWEVWAKVARQLPLKKYLRIGSIMNDPIFNLKEEEKSR